MDKRIYLILTVFLLPCVNTTLGYENADVARGGAMYDNWWEVIDAAVPTTDHPLWALRPDTTSNTRTGADTWRCKECHGWDYKGVNGAYANGSHRTGIAGILNSSKTEQEIFELLKTDHGYGTAGLTDEDIWDLVAFITEGLIDTDIIIGDDGAFIGDFETGKTLYDSGIGTNIGCVTCHGQLGLTPPPGHPDFDDYIGLLSNENPWEFQHKIRFGQPGEAMPSSVVGGGTIMDVADLGTYAQTLPQAPFSTLTINMIAVGHWHVTWPKILNFTVTDESGNPVIGLSPTVIVKSMAGSVTAISAKDKGDGTYSATYRPWDIGSGHSMAYSISFRVQYNGVEYCDAWPVEVRRNGNESIVVTVDDTRYAYQVLYGWDPGTVYASDTDLVNMYFEPLRAVEEGNRVNRFQLFLNTYNHLTDLEPTILLESQDGLVSETLIPTYVGLGVYRAQRVFPVAEVGASKKYTVSFLFTDPYNGYSIEADKTAFSLTASAPEEDTTFEPNAPMSVLLEGKLIFESSCAACHELPTTADFKAFPSDEALITLVNDMAAGAMLSEADAEKVVLYALALRHDVIVAAVRELSRPRTVAMMAGFLWIGAFIPARRLWRRKATA